MRRLAPRTLRWRIALAVTAIAALVAATIGVFVHRASSNDRDQRARTALIERLNLAAEIFADSGQLAVGGKRSSEAIPEPVRAAVAAGRQATYGDGETLWAGRPVPGSEGIFVLASRAADRAALDELDRNLLLVGAGATIAAALLGIFVAAGLSARLADAAAVARRVAAGDIDARVGALGRDEVADLSGALDQMTEALSDRIETEQRFVADVAHELRTPVTGLVSAAELLDESRPAQIVRERTRELRNLVEDLLQVSRLDAGVEAADHSRVELAAAARSAIARTDVTASVEEEARAWLFTDGRRIERILENLLRNAERHGAEPIVVRVSELSISVEDSGPGFEPELLFRGPARFRKGARSPTTGGGSGLGLSIAAGQAEVIGGELRLANKKEGGAVATLLLPAD